MTTVSDEEQVKTLMFGSEFGDDTLRETMTRELRQRLVEAQKEGRPLRVYAGYDPSKPDLHLGHSITMRKLRQFQDFGHDVTFVVGTFTAQVGDTSDKATGRPQLAPEQVFEAAKSYAEQAFTILDREKTRVVYNHEWLTPMTMADVIRLASSFPVTFPILVGLDGKARMSKSSGNYVGLAEAPEEQYGKVMSISDETMLAWIKYVTRWPVDEIEARARRMKAGELHPMELKKALAREVVSMYHDEAAAQAAERHFETVHQKGALPEEIDELPIPGPLPIVEVLLKVQGVKSKGEARRLIDGGGVKIDGDVVKGYDRQVAAACLIQVGKRRFVRVKVG